MVTKQVCFLLLFSTLATLSVGFSCSKEGVFGKLYDHDCDYDELYCCGDDLDECCTYEEWLDENDLGDLDWDPETYKQKERNPIPKPTLPVEATVKANKISQAARLEQLPVPEKVSMRKAVKIAVGMVVGTVVFFIVVVVCCCCLPCCFLAKRRTRNRGMVHGNPMAVVNNQPPAPQQPHNYSQPPPGGQPAASYPPQGPAHYQPPPPAGAPYYAPAPAGYPIQGGGGPAPYPPQGGGYPPYPDQPPPYSAGGYPGGAGGQADPYPTKQPAYNPNAA